ncbi:UTP--glucose-1-phosphate uridylyltransferase [Sulfitobacter sp. THAF37]|uniref:UTP--glucose-1-phosphate uridylyltransferase n=1 Tax=Sulfitobacter sp. THAF37 TaxID=2587855 RepID=UPI001267C17D|nr:UTP--glucose-1-phosphate uridylyltransferase [Sulfitobacter sp. THAF37]QFT57343.1 UTP--glucose-1-phosphate uridylyltransferase [Sulfitobacter sp. THAF37]
MKKTVRTAIFPVAGMGTRFLPATKAVPKELLPVLDTPLIQYVIDEARDAGIERMIFVNHPSKSAIEHYVLDDTDLCASLCEKGKDALARELKNAALDTETHDIVFVHQHEPLGLGHAILCAAEHALPGAVAVLLPDDLILSGTGCLSQMIEAYEAGPVDHMLATMEVPRETVSSYGVLSISHHDTTLAYCDGLVEKPEVEAAPSTQAVVGRYILHGDIFDTLRGQKPGAGGEIQLTDAIAADIGEKTVAGFRFIGKRFDCGSKDGMLSAQLFLAQQDARFDHVIGDFLSANQQMNVA